MSASANYGVTYFLEDAEVDRLVKIGHSTMLGYKERIAALQAGNPRLFRFLGVVPEIYFDAAMKESALHKAFSHVRLHAKDNGQFRSEWFALEHDDYLFLLAACEYSRWAGTTWRALRAEAAEIELRSRELQQQIDAKRAAGVCPMCSTRIAPMRLQ